MSRPSASNIEECPPESDPDGSIPGESEGDGSQDTESEHGPIPRSFKEVNRWSQDDFTGAADLQEEWWGGDRGRLLVGNLGLAVNMCNAHATAICHFSTGKFFDKDYNKLP